MREKIEFNRFSIVGDELHYVKQALDSGKISGDGPFTEKCQSWFIKQYGFKNNLLTTSCSSALELCGLLLDIKAGDEVIVPSYTFSSCANAFELRGANVVFADSGDQSPNVTIEQIEPLISKQTKAIVVVHYAGVSCDMDPIMQLANQHGISVIEDAAHSINSSYKGRQLGGIGHFGTFSFHETKNLAAGECGLLVMNKDGFMERAEIIREKGTDRSAFFRGNIDKYGWVDIGSSYLPSDVLAAILFAQLEKIKTIQKRRGWIWRQYFKAFKNTLPKSEILLPRIPEYATNNGHMFYLVAPNVHVRDNLIRTLSENTISATFHYQALHKSRYFAEKHDGRFLPNSEKYSDCLVRLPLYHSLSDADVDYIVKNVQLAVSKL